MEVTKTQLTLFTHQNNNPLVSDPNWYHKYFKDATEIIFPVYKIHFGWNPIDDTFRPLKESGDIIQIKEYKWPEFINMVSQLCGATKEKVIIWLCFNHLLILSDFEYGFFNGRKCNSIIDYPSTITNLEKKGLVEIEPSLSHIATDERRFRMLDNSNNDDWWEVDILGTTYGSEVSKEILKMYKLH